MTHNELTSPFQPTVTHPYLATISVDPMVVARFLRLAEDHPDIKVQGIDRTQPDTWIIYAACASDTGRDMLESEW
jgi:hypothetical protein